MVRDIIVLGSTGSIGRQALDVARRLELNVTAVSGYNNEVLLEQQCRLFKPVYCWVSEEKYSSLKALVADTDTRVITGREALDNLAYEQADLLLNALMGIRGLIPTLNAIESGKRIALANKETLVAGGDIAMRRAAEKGIEIIPVDSEHSAVFQCLQGTATRPDKLLLTASGGPFHGKKREELKSITPSDALKHPNWSMGDKITIDSSTLMNKGLELIEAVHLFDISPDNIEVIIHRESIIHSMVEFPDNAVLAQLSNPDMRLCIQYAITYPERVPSQVKKTDFYSLGALTFQKPDETTFTLLPLAREAIKKGGNIPAAVNGANEAAVSLFLNGRIKYLDIFDFVSYAAESAEYISNPTVGDIMGTDRAARDFILRRC